MTDASMKNKDYMAFAAFVDAYTQSPKPDVLRDWQERRPRCASEMAEYASILAQAAEERSASEGSGIRSESETAPLTPFGRLGKLFRHLASDSPDPRIGDQSR